MYNEEQALQKVSNHRKKHIVIAIMVGSGLLIVLLGVLLYFYIDNLPLFKVPVVNYSTLDWTSGTVTLSVEGDKNKIDAYSFDGGKNWQEDATYVVTENGDFTIQVRDIKGKLSKKNLLSVTNIDRDPPVMIFENSTIVQMGYNFSVRNGVQISDEISGLSNDYTVTPSMIDTSVEGQYVLTYSAFDRAGNFVEKTRNIIVKDIKGRTYYRFRTGTMQVSQCEPYLCKCVSSSAALELGSCPTGYTLNEQGQCCQTCYNTCKTMIWGEWSEWQQEKVTANSTTEVEMMIRED